MIHRNMDSHYHSLLISIILLGLLPMYSTNASSMTDQDKQRRLFNRISNRLESETNARDETTFDESNAQVRLNPGLRYIAELLKTRQRPPILNSDYDFSDAFQYDSDIEVESQLPYGVQNVYAATGRATRSRGRHKPIFQPLCTSTRETVYLNLDPEYEYRPEFYEEVRCEGSVPHNENYIQTGVCTEAGFSCVQLNGTIFLTRRARGSSCWETQSRPVAAGCECMWPKHTLGDAQAHH